MIDGADSTLDAMEREPVEPKKSRPLNEIKLINVSIRFKPITHRHRIFHLHLLSIHLRQPRWGFHPSVNDLRDFGPNLR